MTFGSQQASSVNFINASHLSAIAPDITGIVDVQVITNKQTSAQVAKDQFTFLPTVTGVNPNSGSPGQSITITGTGFDATTTVKFGTVLATSVTPGSSSQLTAVVPPGVGTVTVHVEVTTAGQTSSPTTNDLFTDPTPVVPAAAPSDPIAKQLMVLINSYRLQKGMKALSSNDGLASVAQKYTEDILANPDPTTDVTLLMANSTPVITCTNEIDAVLSGPDAQQLFDNGIKGNAITLAAINNPSLTSFGGYFTNDPATPGGYKGTIIFGQGVSP